MKKRVWATLCILVLASTTATAQISFNWDEWFRQKKTELKYLAVQLAELQAYLKLVKDGYRIVQQGNQLIEQARKGELSAHDIFYLSLKFVNQRIKNYPAVAHTIDLHRYIAERSQSLRRRVNATPFPYLSEKEKTDALAVLERLRADMGASLDELTDVLSDRQLELSDNERITKVEQLKDYAQLRVEFLQHYYGQVTSLIGQRMAEQTELNTLRTLHK